MRSVSGGESVNPMCGPRRRTARLTPGEDGGYGLVFQENLCLVLRVSGCDSVSRVAMDCLGLRGRVSGCDDVYRVAMTCLRVR